jgi:hypothetical protein
MIRDHLGHSVHLDVDVANSLIGRLPAGPPEKGALTELLCGVVLALEDQSLNLWEVFDPVRIGRVVGPAAIERVFVELNPLATDAPEHHRSKATITDR